MHSIIATTFIISHYENTPIPIYIEISHKTKQNKKKKQKKKNKKKKKHWNSDKKFWYFHISAQNINYGHSLEPPRRSGSNEYPQFMFLNRSKKYNVYHVNPSFYYLKRGLRGSKLYRYVFVMYSYGGIWYCWDDLLTGARIAPVS